MKSFVRQKSIRQATLHGHTKEGSAKNFFSKIFSGFNTQFFWSIVAVLVAIYLGVFFFKKILFVPEYVIQKVQYDSGSLKQFDDPYLYKAITRNLKGENYYVVKREKSSILDIIQGQFPVVSDLEITYDSPNIVHVDILFFEPEMIIKNQDKYFGVYGNYTFGIYSGNTLGSGKEILYLPMYASGLTNIDGLFYKQSAKDLQQQMMLIYAAFPKSNFVAYLPGAERTVIMTSDSKKVFVNNLKDIPEQIKSFELLKRYYGEYTKLKEIDLGSLESDKVIVKK